MESHGSNDSQQSSPLSSEDPLGISLEDIFANDEYGLLEIRKPVGRASSLDRLKTSFLEVQDFFIKNGRQPNPDSDDVFESKLGSRLAGIRLSDEKLQFLTSFDEHGILQVCDKQPQSLDDIFSGADSSLFDDSTGLLDLSSLPVESRKVLAAGESAARVKCMDFENYKAFFKQKHEELSKRSAKLAPFTGRHRIVAGSFFILNGLMVFVAEVGEVEYKKTTVRENRRERLRLIFENGTESAMYRQSLSLRLSEDGAGREVVSANYEILSEDDSASGWIYVAKSLSDDPRIASRRDLYKIGFTTTPVAKRVARAKNDPTYLMADVLIVGEYRTYNLRASALEHLLHRAFADVRLSLNQTGNDGKEYDVTEWFEVPLETIDHAINAIVSGEIVDLSFDKSTGKLNLRS